jgi:LacI family transcriptional regulator
MASKKGCGKTVENKSADSKAKKTRAVSSPRPTSAKGKSEDSERVVSFAPKKRVTLADVARRARVSRTTVSLTMANRRDIIISDATREHVKRCADAIGYIPSRLGDGFFSGRSKLIGVLVLADYYLPFLECFAGIQQELAKADYIPLTVTSNWLNGHTLNQSSSSGRPRVPNLPGLSRLLEYQVEGIIHFSMDLAHTAACIKTLAREKIPMVALGGDIGHKATNIDVVGGDNETIGRMVADHLLSTGCKSFAFGMPAPAHSLEKAVCASFAARLKEAGYACRNFAVNRDNPGDLSTLLSRLVKPPAGVFCGRDSIAALALRAAFSLGWQVPNDFAVVGMGRSAISKFNILPITTVERNSFIGGETAARLLIQRIEGFSGKPQRILIQSSLSIRASSVSDTPWLLSSVD